MRVFQITDRMKGHHRHLGRQEHTPSKSKPAEILALYLRSVVIGDKRLLTCLVMIDQENVEKFAQDHDIPFTITPASAARRSRI